MKITIFSVNKTKEAWLDEAISEYVKRLKNQVEIETHYCKNDQHLLTLLEKQKKAFALDPKGKMVTSEEFSQLVIDELFTNKEFKIIIGGPEGLPEKIKEKYP